MGDCLDRGIKVVSNAGGLAPAACAEAVHAVADKLGLAPVDRTRRRRRPPRSRSPELRAAGHTFENLDTGAPLGDAAGVDGERVPRRVGHRRRARPRRRHRRSRDARPTPRSSSDRRPGTTAGRATTGTRWPARSSPDTSSSAARRRRAATTRSSARSPVSSIPGSRSPRWHRTVRPSSPSTTRTAGSSRSGTVTAQLLYEIGGPAYLNPDVTARFDTIELEQVGRDRVRISGVRRRAAAADVEGVHQLRGRASDDDDPVPHRARRRGEGGAARARPVVEHRRWPRCVRGRHRRARPQRPRGPGDATRPRWRSCASR